MPFSEGKIFATNLSKSVNSIGGSFNGPIELTDFCRFVAKICQWKTALDYVIYNLIFMLLTYIKCIHIMYMLHVLYISYM